MGFHLLGPKGRLDLDLGDWFRLVASWKELAAHVGVKDAQFKELLLVPYTNEEPLRAEDLVKVRAQATIALATYASGLSVHTRWLLESLTRGSTGEEI